MDLSVAMCTYNGAKFIEKQLESIFSQTVPVNQIIICDDGSTDGTIEIVEKYHLKYPNIITFIKNTVNLKSNKNFEKAISLCEGDFIFLSDQDDIWVKEKVEKTLAIFNENPSAEGMFSNADLIDDNGDRLSDYTLWDIIFFLEKELEKPLNLFDIIKQKGNIVTGATLCVKSKTLKSLIPFPDSKHILHDGWIALALSFQKTLFYSHENLIHYRIHSGQQVGGSELGRIEKTKELVKQIFKLSSPKSFNEYKRLYRKYRFNIEQFKDIEAFVKDKNFFDYNMLIRDNQKSNKDLETAIKSKYYFQFYIKVLKNKLLQNGKRI